MIYKIAIIGYVILYTGIVLAIRSLILYRNTGINPFKKMGDTGIKGFNEKIMILGATLIPVIAIIYMIGGSLYEYLVPIKYLEINGLKQFGIVIMLIGCVIGIIAQFQMGDSWRIGIDEKERTELITNKLYRYSRNPIYLGLLISLMGFFFIAPNALSLCCLVLSYPSVEIKIRLEEEYLIQKHGEKFQEYMEKVNRWI
ncbi:MAG: isoprenylcysteine carboxylmethyltransferase family protein [Maribacter arcticus]|uniref:methyltransferase family protein n=1 Tax=Maribacter arcticus TaxID=561365 RepID=UPI003002F475